MTIRAASMIFLTGIALFPAANPQAAAQSTALFEGDAIARSPQGAARPVHVSVAIWKFSRGAGAQQIPSRDFYLARLVSGDVGTVIDGVRVQRAPDDLWTVKAGSSMQVEVLGQFAVIETIAIGSSAGRRANRP